MIINPYANTDWTKEQVYSFSHEHCETQAQFEYPNDSNVRHLAFSNYHPSLPYYPLSDFFSNIKPNKIGSPNAENSGCTNTKGTFHFNSLGSFWASGERVDNTYQYAFKKIIETLQYPDAGGITINHPVWSDLPYKEILKYLDYDTERVLGIEIFNDSCQRMNGKGYALTLWDQILLTGRKCWGFAVPDHYGVVTQWFFGINVLIPDSETEHDCLKAYRTGSFYSKLEHWSDLKFSNINYTNNTLTVEAPIATEITVIIDGTPTTYQNNSIEIAIPTSAIYFRIEATKDDDKIFSNPIILKPKLPTKYTENENMILLFE